jgi:hypothetical protein
LHPCVDLKQVKENAFRLRHERGVTGTLSASGTEVVIEQGMYCPEFGKRLERPVLVLRGESELPIQLSYQLQFLV